jgi:5-methylcytosine-specific restriction endonuclease McrA
MSTPPPEEQVRFLTDIQRLLEGGSFVATYKYALLLALADLSVERGDDSGAALHVPLDAIADKFIEYYWGQCRQFVPPGGKGRGVLRQNIGKQATIIHAVLRGRRAVDGRMAALQGEPRSWRELRSSVRRTVKAMPLWRLQTIGGREEEFLYERRLIDRGIVLKPGTAFCFRRFHALIGDVVRGAWVRYIRRFNGEVVGDSLDLHDFLFGANRHALRAAAPVLYEIQGGRCLYTESRLQRPESGEVDHFIPFARYPHDFGHNLVLASRRANAQKSDHLAAEEHLERWVQRNHERGQALREGFESIKVPVDLARTVSIASWSYAQHAESSAPVWRSGRDADAPLSGRWLELLAS